jgi:FkbM family methyltransferase
MNLVKAFSAARNPANWWAMAHGVVPTIEHAPAFGGIEPDTVIDVGANKGQFSSFARSRWPHAKLLAFEPIPAAARRYRRILGRRAELFDCALGAEKGRLDLHLASRADSSSLLSLGQEQKSIFATDEVGTLPVEVRRLDDVLDGLVVSPALLKIDVQGYEFEVLAGLGKLAECVRWVYAETSFVELYTGQKLHDEVVGLLAGLGYEQVLEHNLVMDRGRKIQADILFQKRAG